MRKFKGPRAINRNVFSIVVMAVIYSINAFLVLPVVRMLTNDVIYADSFFVVILEYIAGIMEVCAVSVSYALLLSALYEGQRTRGAFVIFASLTWYKNLATTAVLWWEAGGISDLWIWDIVDDIYFTALELLLFYIIYAISRRAIGRYTDQRLIAQRVYEKTGEMAPIKPVYPFERVYDKTNCLLYAALVCAVATFIAKLGGELANDVMYIVAYGLPKEGITWLYMIINYVSKALFGVIVYFSVYISLDTMLKKGK
ncbi:MAG: hypothetical protein IKJ24_04765 [Clostridia bacterium]|nr:hypothetical protein [Clostridia bacterium]